MIQMHVDGDDDDDEAGGSDGLLVSTTRPNEGGREGARPSLDEGLRESASYGGQ